MKKLLSSLLLSGACLALAAPNASALFTKKKSTALTEQDRKDLTRASKLNKINVDAKKDLATFKKQKPAKLEILGGGTRKQRKAHKANHVKQTRQALKRNRADYNNLRAAPREKILNNLNKAAKKSKSRPAPRPAE